MRFPAQQWLYRFDAFTLDPGNEDLRTVDGSRIPLRGKSFALLRLMLENAGRLLGRDMIMEALWPNIIVSDDSITQCVIDVRRALGRESGHLLRTIPRRGYIFEAEVVRQERERFPQVIDSQVIQPRQSPLDATSSDGLGSAPDGADVGDSSSMPFVRPTLLLSRAALLLECGHSVGRVGCNGWLSTSRSQAIHLRCQSHDQD